MRIVFTLLSLLALPNLAAAAGEGRGLAVRRAEIRTAMIAATMPQFRAQVAKALTEGPARKQIARIAKHSKYVVEPTGTGLNPVFLPQVVSAESHENGGGTVIRSVGGLGMATTTVNLGARSSHNTYRYAHEGATRVEEAHSIGTRFSRGLKAALADQVAAGQLKSGDSLPRSGDRLLWRTSRSDAPKLEVERYTPNKWGGFAWQPIIEIRPAAK